MTKARMLIMICVRSQSRVWGAFYWPSVWFCLVILFKASVPSCMSFVKSLALLHMAEHRMSVWQTTVIAVFLQNLAEILNKVWAVSIVSGCLKQQDRSYLDVIIIFYWTGCLSNFYMISLQMLNRHSGAKMMSFLTKFFGALYEHWKYLIVRISTDGDRSMTGWIGDVVTRILTLLPPGATRVWCGLHQRDLVMQFADEKAFGIYFLILLTKMIGNLKRQQNFVTRMRTKCPKCCAIRWLSMCKLFAWLSTVLKF